MGSRLHGLASNACERPPQSYRATHRRRATGTGRTRLGQRLAFRQVKPRRADEIYVKKAKSRHSNLIVSGKKQTPVTRVLKLRAENMSKRRRQCHSGLAPPSIPRAKSFADLANFTNGGPPFERLCFCAVVIPSFLDGGLRRTGALQGLQRGLDEILPAGTTAALEADCRVAIRG